MKRWNMSLRFVCNSEELLERKFPSVLHRQWSISILADPQPHIDVWPVAKRLDKWHETWKRKHLIMFSKFYSDFKIRNGRLCIYWQL